MEAYRIYDFVQREFLKRGFTDEDGWTTPRGIEYYEFNFKLDRSDIPVMLFDARYLWCLGFDYRIYDRMTIEDSAKNPANWVRIPWDYISPNHIYNFCLLFGIRSQDISVAYDVVEELGGLERRLTEYPAKLSDEQRTEIAIFHPNWSADTMRDVRLELERCELKEFHEHEHNYQAFIDSLKKLKHNNEGRWSDEIISSREALVKELIERHELRELDSIDFTAPEWTELEL
jgi:hypothetical protein